MILVRWVWLALPLFAQALSPVANSTPVSAHLISLSDPYRGIRPSCLADLDPASCERLPIPPQNVPEGICVENNSQGNSSCVADAIAKTEATLEEKLQDLKESLAQDGVIPDDFVTFEKWKAGQFQVLQDSGDDKNPKRDEDPIEKKALGVNSSTADISVLKGKWETPSIEDSGDKHSRKNRRLSTPLDNTQRSPKATAQQKASSLSPHRYNYASPDCSARIHSASPQSQHASSVLHKSKDRYMLTPCSAKEHWVIIELCDDIRIEAVEIGMFEFFSGIVKEVKLSIGGADDDEEVQDEDKSAWQEVGSFIGKSVRGTQTFTLDHPTSFQRFIRLDFPTHYGNEYYCPVSSIKVYGMNQMEAFKWESRRQKEAEMNRKRLEENAKRALETVTIAGTILPQVPPSRSSHAAENTTESAVAGSSTHKSMEVVSATPAAGSGQAAGSTPLTSISDATVAHAATQATTLETFDTGGPLPTGTSSMHDIGRQAIDTKMISPSLPVSNINVPPPTTTSLSPSPKGASNTLPDSLSEASSSVLLTDDVLPNAPKYSTSQPAIPRQEVRADSSESIYAYIIRRLNALEANSTLGMMYMEEQTKATRGILQRLENHLADWKAQINSSHQLAILQERSAFDKRLDDLLLKTEQRDTLLERETRSLRSHIRQLREQIAWEQQKTWLHIAMNVIIASFFYIGLVNQKHSQNGAYESRDSSALDGDSSHLGETRTNSPILGLSRTQSPFETYHRNSLKSRVSSYSKLYSRRPSTPNLQKHRYKDLPSDVQPQSSDQLAVHFGSPEGVKPRPSLSTSLRVPGPRRLARSAHLHTLSNASRMQNRSKQGIGAGSAEHGGDPVNRKSAHRRHIQTESPVTHRSKWEGEKGLRDVDVLDDGSSDRASASEAEDGIDSVTNSAT